MIAYPVHYTVEQPARYTRLQLLVRLVASVALGLLGLSLGLVYLAAIVALPAFAAVRIGSTSQEAYLRDDAPRVVRLLTWFAAGMAWFALVTDALPSRSPDEQVHVVVEPMGTPSAASSLWRLLVGVPSAVVLVLLAGLGGFVWIWSVLKVLLVERVGAGAHAYLVGVQRWSVRLLAYQASLVDVYPPFSFEDGPPLLAPALVP